MSRAHELTYHEVYGEVSHEQLRAYRKYNVSQSDHDSLVTYYSEAAHRTITAAVRDPANHVGGSFSWFKWYNDKH